MSRPPPFGPVYAAFALAYLLSYVFRVVNAVLAPDLTRDLGLDPSTLGLLTSTYLLAFGLMQIPAGLLLDRYGPRRVAPALLVVAAAGAFAFARADSLTGLLAARALIGVGVCVGLMAPLQALAIWYPPERRASQAGWIMVAGGVGALAATAPLEYALRFVTWRTVFVGLGVASLVAAAAIAWRIPDVPRSGARPTFGAQLAGVRDVLRHRRFWWLAPLGATGMGSFMAIQGLWAVPWLMEVNGMSRKAAADVLFVTGVVVLAGYFLLGTFAVRLARRGVQPAHLYGGGFALHTLALAAIVAGLPFPLAWWMLFGLGASGNVLAFTVLGEGFPRELAARASTTLNLVMFAASFAAQWGIGVVAEAVRSGGGSAAQGMTAAFAVVLAADVLGLAWLLRGWRGQMPRRAAAVGA